MNIRKEDALSFEARNWADRLGVRVEEFINGPSTIPRKNSPYAVEMLMNYLGAIAVVHPEYEDALTAIECWQDCLKQEDGCGKISEALGISSGRPEHDVGLICTTESFLPRENLTSRLVRVEPGHPLWPSDIPPLKEWSFGYVIEVDGQAVAQSIPRLNSGVLGGSLWAVGVGVHPDYRQQGYGHAVASATTRDVLSRDGIALWNTRIANTGSIALAKSIGYCTYQYYMAVPMNS